MKYLFVLVLSTLAFNACGKDAGTPDMRVLPVEVGESFRLVIGSAIFTATFYDTSAAGVFRTALPLAVIMRDMNSNEKYYDLPQSLPVASSRPGAIRSGDLMLCGASTLVLFYKTFSSSYSYTRLGRVNDPAGLEAAPGSGNVSVRFELVN